MTTSSCPGSWALLLLLACALPSAAQGVALPYAESFESPSWAVPEWTIAVSDPAGQIQAIAPTVASPDGGLVAAFDVSVGSTDSTNTLTLSLDLLAAPAAVLKYWAREIGDDPNAEDGLFLNDGVSPVWPRVVDHTTLTSSWVEFTVNLATAAAMNGLAVTSTFQVRFSQRDNFPMPSDGLQIDGVRIFEPPTGQPNTAVASLTINNGLNLLGQPGSFGNAGPFFASAPAGGVLTLTVLGAPNQPWALAAGPLNPNNAFFAGIGSLDLGLMGGADLSDVAIVLDGNAPGILNQLARTGPSGSSVLTFPLPALPPGPWLSFQAGVFNGPVLTLTAATQVSVP